MIYNKNNKYLRSFVINHKKTINTNVFSYVSVEANIFVKIFIPPLSCVHEKFSRRLRVTFKLFVYYFEPKWYTGGFFLPNGANVANFWIGTIIQCTCSWIL